MEKKSIISCFVFIIVLSSFVLASKIEVSTTKETFSVGESITLKVSLYDSSNNPIDAGVNIIIEDAEKITKIEQMVPSNRLIDVSLGEKARYGYWKITAKYTEPETNELVEGTALFMIEMNEQAKFEIEGDKLIITNIGNTRYTKTIDIIIGETLGTKKVDLDAGEKISFRLIAPDGVYNIKVTDGKTSITKQDVALTGKVIGILDESLASGGNPLTGGVKPEETNDDSFYSSIKSRNFVYVFVLVVIGAAVLLAIERNYRRRI